MILHETSFVKHSSKIILSSSNVSCLKSRPIKNNLGTVRLQYTGNETRCGDSTRTIGSLYSCDRDKRFYLEHVLRVTFKACMTIAAYQMLFERVLRLTGEKKAFMAATYLFLRWKMASLDIAN
ncbi:hypothetical protein Plhal304r1_c004g0017301 [Plasmopara halstedii]